jgi:hypothetical protein
MRLLPSVTLGLLVLVLADRAIEWREQRHAPERRASQGATDTRPAAADLQAAGEDVAMERTGTRLAAEAGDLGHRAAVLEHLTREVDGTYLDSLIVSTDSVVRRWPDRWGTPLRVHLVPGGAAGYTPRMAEFAREAFDRWEQTGVGVRFEVVPDSSEADVLVRWIDRFDFDRAGQTDLTWDQLGRVRHATVSLALHTQNGTPLPEAALFAVAVHEAGHAIGLPHSADTSDVMYPATRTGTLTERDRRSIRVLYRLQPGPVGERYAR